MEHFRNCRNLRGSCLIGAFLDNSKINVLFAFQGGVIIYLLFDEDLVVCFSSKTGWHSPSRDPALPGIR